MTQVRSAQQPRPDPPRLRFALELGLASATLVSLAGGGAAGAQPTGAQSTPPGSLPAPGGAGPQESLERREAMAVRLERVLAEMRSYDTSHEGDLQAAPAAVAALADQAAATEARLTSLAAAQFSPTTRLQSSTYVTLGANRFGGSQSGPYPPGPDAAGIPARSRNAWPAANNADWGGAVMNYEIHLNLLTSFTGRDLLYTRLNSGNANRSSVDGNPFNLLALDKSTAPSGGRNVAEITRLFYRFPLNRQVTALIGPLARPSHEITALRPWFYGADPGPAILDVFSLNGAPATYNKASGATAGVMWQQQVPEGRPYLATSLSYVAPNADSSTAFIPGGPGSGIGGRLSRASLFAQVGVGGPGYVLAAAWRRGQCDLNVRRGTQFANQRQPCAPAGSGETAHSDNVALTAAWQPLRAGWIPSINLGWGASFLQQAGSLPVSFNSASNIAESRSWGAALVWRKLFGSGHAAGLAVGQPTFVTRLRDGRTPQDGNYAWEFWTALQISDAITLTPALYYLSRPNGQFTPPGTSSHALGAMLVTHFRF